MSKQTPETGLKQAQQPFGWIDRYLKPIARLADIFRKPPAARIELTYWLIALAGIAPALRAELLFPFDWARGLGLDYTVTWIDPLLKSLPFASADTIQIVIVTTATLLLSFLLFVLAIAQRSYSRLLAILPYFVILLPYLAIKLAIFKAQPSWLLVANGLYACTAFVLFLYFIVAGRIRSLYFVIFVVMLTVWKSLDPFTLFGWKQIIAFVAASIVLSLIYETVRQNWPLLTQIGRSGALALLRRTFSLWSPTLVMIAIGLWLSNQISSGTEEMLYDQGVVTRYCIFPDAQPASPIKCPQAGTTLRRAEIDYDRDRYRIRVVNDIPQCKVRDETTANSAFPVPPIVFGCPAGFSEVTGAELYDRKKDNYIYSLSRAPFIKSLQLTMAEKFDKAKSKLNRAAGKFEDAHFRDPIWVEQEARRMFSFVPRDTGLVESKCAFLDANCGIANLVKYILNGAYADIRSRAERRFVAQAVTRAEVINKQADEMAEAATDEFGCSPEKTTTGNLAEAAKHVIDCTLDKLKDQTLNTISRVYQISKVMQILFTAWLIIIAIKSFLYVFSRVIFDKSTDIHVDLLEAETDARQGSVKHLQEINIPGEYPYDIFYKSNYQPLGPAPRFSIPQWSSSLLSRLRNGAWNMNCVAMPLDDHRGVTFNAIEAEYLVDWQMEDGEEVIFNYDNFVAMNENIELRTVISLRVATMLMGRFIFHTARCKGGPGRLILRTRGKPATAEQVRQSIPSSRLIAWNRYARFSVDSHLTRADIFLNGFNLRRSDADDDGKPQGIIIVEADARSGSIMTGTLRFAKHFLLPV